MRFVLLLLLLFSSQFGHAQIIHGSDTLYGNEWIDFSKTYYKIKVAADGIYRVPYAMLQNAPDIASAPGSELRLYHNGEEVPMYVTTDGLFGGSDFVEFYGRKNRGELDRHLFEDPETQQVNPEYSMFNDTSAYYLVNQPEGGAPLRMVGVANDLSNVPAKEEWCWYTVDTTLISDSIKRDRSYKVLFSLFDGDGWGGSISQSPAITLELPHITNILQPANLSVRYGAKSLQFHRLQLVVNNLLMATDSFDVWKVVQQNKEISHQDLTESTNIRVNAVYNNLDQCFIAAASIRYARSFDFDGISSIKFALEPSESIGKYLEINDFSSGMDAPILMDFNNRIRIEATVENNTVKAFLPPYNLGADVLLTASTNIKNIDGLTPHKFTDFRNVNADYIIVSNKKLFSDPENNGANWVQEYADYRSSTEGGNYTVATLEINELYEQFAWGQRFHPAALRHLVQYVHKNWTDPKYLFIIGKSLNYPEFRDSLKQEKFADSLFYVPSHGFWGADVPFTMSGGGLTTPLISIGRLAAIRPAEIKYYLDKVKEHEQQLSLGAQDIPSRQWMKRIVHNGGGNDADEQQLIRSYVNELKGIAENNRFGGEVSSFFKASNDPIQLTGYEQMQELINSGISLWTIFGHSSVTFVDYDIGEANSYNNKGRYPFMLVNGCYSGICSNVTKGIGENFVMEPDRGAIAYCAMVFNGYTGALKEYSKNYYQRMGGVDYGKTIGEQLKNTTTDLINAQSPDLQAALHQFQLQGDPAVRLHSFPGPDYTPDATSVSVAPNPVSLDDDKVDLKVSIANIGENSGGDLVVRIEQQLPDNTQVLRILDTIPAPAFETSLQYQIDVNGSQPGFNRFNLTVDPLNVIEEKPSGAEQNNELLGGSGVEVFFYSNEIDPLYPNDYGILDNNSVTFSVTSLNTAPTGKKVLFELDTLETFDTPWKKVYSADQIPGLITWSPDVVLKDSMVYYWRVAKDTLLNNAYLWKTRSFVHLANSEPGWNQSDFGQYINGLFSNILRDSVERNLEYAEDNSSISMQVAHRWGSGGIGTPGLYPGIQNAYFEGAYGDYSWGGVKNEVVVVVADQNTGRFVQLPPNSIYNPNNYQLFYAKFDTRDSAQRLKLMTYLTDVVTDGNYVGLMAFNIAFEKDTPFVQ
ncbi:MAG: hypothetical protein IT270_00465, partial [Saprospiraceae bacterium]|nr:hypothetical protein [Saprospiraceae bacterium]